VDALRAELSRRAEPAQPRRADVLARFEYGKLAADLAALFDAVLAEREPRAQAGS
jgi:hypothetical protein